jgi:hypothetical protein
MLVTVRRACLTEMSTDLQAFAYCHSWILLFLRQKKQSEENDRFSHDADMDVAVTRVTA